MDASPICRSASRPAPVGRLAVTVPVRARPRSSWASAITRSGGRPLSHRPDGHEAQIAEQLCYQARCGMQDQLVGRADLEQFAAAEDGEVIGEGLGVGELVGDQDGGDESLGDQGAHRFVRVRRRLASRPV
jgi:hypothetical protein